MNEKIKLQLTDEVIRQLMDLAADDPEEYAEVEAAFKEVENLTLDEFISSSVCLEHNILGCLKCRSESI